MALVITDEIFKEILTEVGIPILDVTDLELTKNQIKNLLIWPAVREFFKWFPLQSITDHNVSTSFSIDFPTSETYTVVDARLNVGGYQGVGITGNPLLNEFFIRRSYGGYYGGVYGTRNNYGFYTARLAERTLSESVINYDKAFNIRIDEANSKVLGYTNVAGKLFITWGEYSEDFSNVHYTHIDEVIKLARVNILRYLGMLRNQDASDLPNELDGDDFISRADKLEDEIITGWKKHSKVIILRG